MTKTLKNYQNMVIYKIVCKDLTIIDLYVGSTTHFVKRKSHHKFNSVNDTKKIYQTIRENGGWENWEMIEIEKYPCNDGNEARARERYWYEELNAILNTNKPLTTIEERKDEKKDYDKNYRQTQREEIKIKQKIFYEKNKEYILERNRKYKENYRKKKSLEII